MGDKGFDFSRMNGMFDKTPKNFRMPKLPDGPKHQTARLEGPVVGHAIRAVDAFGPSLGGWSFPSFGEGRRGRRGRAGVDRYRPDCRRDPDVVDVAADQGIVRRQAGGPGPGPCMPEGFDPRGVNDRESLVKAFEIVSMILCGPTAKAWNHATIATALLREYLAKDPEGIDRLAVAYALARYTRAGESLPPIRGPGPPYALRPRGGAGGMSRFALSALIACSTLAPAAGQDAKPAPELPPWGTEVFRGLLSFSGCKPDSLPSDLPEARPTGTFRQRIVIVSGIIPRADQHRADELSNYIRNTVNAGGSVLIAIREPYDLSRLLPAPVEHAVTTPGLAVLRPREYAGLAARGPETGLPDRVRPAVRPRRPAPARPIDPRRIPSRAFPASRPSSRPASRRRLIRHGPSFPSPGYPRTVGSVPSKEERRRVTPRSRSAGTRATAGRGRVNSSSWPTKSPLQSDHCPPGYRQLSLRIKLLSVLNGPDEEKRTRSSFIENGNLKDSFDDVTFSVKPTPPLPIPPPQDDRQTRHAARRWHGRSVRPLRRGEFALQQESALLRLPASPPGRWPSPAWRFSSSPGGRSSTVIATNGRRCRSPRLPASSRRRASSGRCGRTSSSAATTAP